MMNKSTISFLLLFLLPSLAMGLDSDKDAPVAIQADSTEINFRTGSRTLTGNVIIDQGTLHIEADKVIVKYKGNALDTATAWGKPVKFRQLPEGKKEEVHGEGRILKLEHAKNLVTLKDQAKLTQGSNTVNGRIIYYNTMTEKMTIKGQPRPKQQIASKKSGKAGKNDKGVEKKTTSTGRTRIIIQPGALKQP